MWFRPGPADPARGPKALAAFGALALWGWSFAAEAEAPLRLIPSAPSEAGGAERVAREGDLGRLRADQRKAAETEARLAAEIAEIGQDRQRLSAALVRAAARMREIEERIAASETRLAALDRDEGAIRMRLDARQGAVSDLLAALQRIGRNAPPALLLRPEDALGAVRTGILLGAVLPEMREGAERLAADLAGLKHVRQEIAGERDTLERDRARLADDQTRMAALVEERQKRQSEAERALEGEHQRAAALARQAENLKDLLARLDTGVAGLRGALPGAENGAAASGRTANAPLRESQRLEPAMAFAATKGALPLPVRGVKIRDFGGSDGIGGTQKGLSVATRPGAPVTSPCDGWVVYAGPFRSYGQLLILNAGGGYHVLLAGMERVSVDLGQFVLTGEPVATMGGGARGGTGAGSGQPTLYVEFRKDGTPIDPGPWWANTDSEKVRG